MALRGPVGESWWGRRALLLLVVAGEAVFRCRGRFEEGLRRGLGPPCPLLVPDQGFCVPLGVEPFLPQASVSKVTRGVVGPGPPPI